MIDDDDIQEYKKPWVALTDDDRKQIREACLHSHLMTAEEYATSVQLATEYALFRKNT